ncbi:hypothetical protein ANME2D_02861 [Candidatus Methanoperedens nitroreducens]|uniref:Uncharacterized protein n=1 Tax=Candidatus Methanoperedens nitratireducens TaxID=1392998 RepID=A0A062UUY7_9EURY|nr:hypothetical protein [Candidatus Methanoperedens nitroreducens]KCZ70836.1 hypothetical protein ANME2D_02861 [Candidatus Methanoperedens nitroreducens]MDJ1420691.1 hypothetical protein [Candidatus Methanoperedens sp.]
MGVIWQKGAQLENGKLGSASNSNVWIEDVGGSGWEHIRHNHVIHPRGNQFLRYGEKYADEAEIQNLIMDSTKNGEKIIKDGDMWYIYEVPNSGGKKLSTLVGSNGYVVTSIPESII